MNCKTVINMTCYNRKHKSPIYDFVVMLGDDLRHNDKIRYSDTNVANIVYKAISGYICRSVRQVTVSRCGDYAYVKMDSMDDSEVYEYKKVDLTISIYRSFKLPFTIFPKLLLYIDIDIVPKDAKWNRHMKSRTYKTMISLRDNYGFITKLELIKSSWRRMIVHVLDATYADIEEYNGWSIIIDGFRYNIHTYGVPKQRSIKHVPKRNYQPYDSEESDEEFEDESENYDEDDEDDEDDD